MAVLVTGGAGYIGAHVVRALRARGDDVVVVDDLSHGSRTPPAGVPLVRLDLAGSGAAEALAPFLTAHRVESVIHLAADKRVDESMRRPVEYWRRNVGGLVALLAAMRTGMVRTMVFSSSAAVYGAVDGATVAEDAPLRPINPYGETKLAGELLIRAVQASGDLDACCLRYFNVAGAGDAGLRDTAEANLIPIVEGRLRRGLRPVIFGTDLSTPDGTCVRDYVHVSDLADAHLAALDALGAGRCGPVYNVGTGRGSSVREVVAEVAQRLGLLADPVEAPPRPGDPAVVVADPALIGRELGWSARLGLREIVASAVATSL